MRRDIIDNLIMCVLSPLRTMFVFGFRRKPHTCDVRRNLSISKILTTRNMTRHGRMHYYIHSSRTAHHNILPESLNRAQYFCLRYWSAPKLFYTRRTSPTVSTQTLQHTQYNNIEMLVSSAVLPFFSNFDEICATLVQQVELRASPGGFNHGAYGCCNLIGLVLGPSKTTP